MADGTREPQPGIKRKNYFITTEEVRGNFTHSSIRTFLETLVFTLYNQTT